MFILLRIKNLLCFVLQKLATIEGNNNYTNDSVYCNNPGTNYLHCDDSYLDWVHVALCDPRSQDFKWFGACVKKFTPKIAIKLNSQTRSKVLFLFLQLNGVFQGIFVFCCV
jgi:hypothetical protein